MFRIAGNSPEPDLLIRDSELVAAEKEYHSAQQNEYAQKIYRDEGQHNGLYWKAADGQPQSPIGPLVASAVAEGYAKGQGTLVSRKRFETYVICAKNQLRTHRVLRRHRN